VVGVVHDIRGAFRESPKPQIFAPESWAPWTINSFAVRYEREPLPTDSSALKRALYEYDPEIIVWWSNSVQDWLNTQLWAERFTFTALRMLGSMAIVLTAVGMFSAMAYAVDRRMNEFGIRLALGALPTNLVVLVLKTGLRLVALGVAFGIAASLALTRFIQSLLFETSPTEPLVFVGVVALLVATTCAACALPAVRAKKADVMRLLRTE
jgi:putative ABC transport system permease protein